MPLMPHTALDSWRQKLLKQDPLALARLVTIVENHVPGYDRLLDELFPHTGHTLRIGITGPPGAGKSTLVDQLAQGFRAGGQSVGVLACDPSSPFSGGALLGDRVRMHRAADDAGVFIRSVASRDSLGGLSQTTNEVALLFEAYGVDVLLLETVGVGQAEVDVMHAADCAVVVLVPQSGDVVQAMKAGLMEIADVFCINKCDQPGANLLEQSLHQLLGLSMRAWSPPIVQTAASQGQGIPALQEAIRSHQAYLGPQGLAQRRQRRLAYMLRQGVERQLRRNLWNGRGEALLAELVLEVTASRRTPSEAVNLLLEQVHRDNPS